LASTSFNEFRYNIMDARRLHQAHGILSRGTAGKKGLGHITRSGVVMLCAAWEQYQEAVLIEGASFLSQEVSDPNELPTPIKKHLSDFVKVANHELKPMELAGEGWRALYLAVARAETNALNTPKSGNLKKLYKRLLGLEDVTSYWDIGAASIDAFVGVRGDISHRGRNADYIAASVLADYIEMISKAASQNDNALCDYLKSTADTTHQPWRRTARVV
jgi:hypothetical protein